MLRGLNAVSVAMPAPQLPNRPDGHSHVAGHGRIGCAIGERGDGLGIEFNAHKQHQHNE